MLEKIDLIGSGKVVVEGNTKKSLQPSKALGWCFTWNNYPEDGINRLKKLSVQVCEYGFGMEKGEKGTPHLQGWVLFKKPNRPSSLGLPKQIHWERMKGNIKDNKLYCSKDGHYYTNIIEVELAEGDLIESDGFYDWQVDILKIISNPPQKRRIYWYWSELGGIGKTEFCKYLCYYHNAIPLEGKKNDVLFCAASFPSLLYVWDLERDMEECMKYGAIEKIKNGFYMCAKYESKPILRKTPHVFIFANFKPDRSKLSEDRWVIRNVDKENYEIILNI